MPTLTFAQIADMTGGALVQGGDVVTSSVVIDSREAKPDSVFFAIKGDRLKPNDAMKLLSDYERLLNEYTYLSLTDAKPLPQPGNWLPLS